MELLINTHFNKPNEEQHVTYITPLAIEERGCMLSFAFSFPIERVFAGLIKRGVVVRRFANFEKLRLNYAPKIQ